MGAVRWRTLAGYAFIATGIVLILGFISAETLYPGYSARTQTISALGHADAPDASQCVFNGSLLLAGTLTVVAAVGVDRGVSDRLLAVMLAVVGLVGLIGLGLFPAHTGFPHRITALVTFTGVGIVAIFVAVRVAGPFRVTSAVLGLTELTALGLFLTLRGGTPLGIGGLERWVAYLGVAWAIGYGAWLLPRNRSPGRQ